MITREKWFELWYDNDPPGMGWRRRWSFGRDQVGFVSKGFFLLYLFLPHVGMAWAAAFIGLYSILGWPFGLSVGDMPNALGLLLLPMGIGGGVLLTRLVLGRQGVYIDRVRGTVVQYGGLGLLFLPVLPLTRRTLPLEQFKRVVLKRDARKSGKSSTSTYAVRLQRAGADADGVLVVDHPNEVKARALAEEIAAFTRLPLEDQRFKESSLREPELLDEPLRETLRREGRPVRVPPPPENPAAVCGREGRARVARIARPPWAGGWAVKALLGSVLIAALCHYYPPREPEHPHARIKLEDDGKPLPSLWPWRIEKTAYHVVHYGYYVAAACAGLALLAVLGYALERPYGCELRADASGLRIRREGLWTRTFDFPQAELEEFRLVRNQEGARMLVAISDRRQFRLDGDLTEEELAYLRAFLIQGLLEEDA